MWMLSPKHFAGICGLRASRPGAAGTRQSEKGGAEGRSPSTNHHGAIPSLQQRRRIPRSLDILSAMGSKMAPDLGAPVEPPRSPTVQYIGDRRDNK